MKLRKLANAFEAARILGRKRTILRALKQSMKVSHLACTALLCALAGCLGYLLQSQSDLSESFSGAKSIPQLYDLIVHNSFSIIQNTREDLESMCVRLKLEAEVRLEQARLPIQPRVSGAVPEALLAGIIRDLQSEMHDFEGTDEELDLAEDLLRALKQAEQTDRWVDVYLKALYEHPTHRIVALFADQALLIGKEAGREEEVIAGLTHVSSIPRNFQGKDKVEAVLMEADTRRQVTRSEVAAFANR
jgi:hypothetical protein